MSTASEVLLIFATQIFSCLCNNNAIVFILTKGNYCNRNTPKPNTTVSSLPLGIKIIPLCGDVKIVSSI